jgi:hypothetical protein
VTLRMSWRARRADGGGDGGTHGCTVGGELSAVSGSQKPKFSSIWVEERLRNGSETARETAEFRPRSRPARLLEVINDRGESHCHRNRHRGGRALPVPGCPQGHLPRRSTLTIVTSEVAPPHIVVQGYLFEACRNNKFAENGLRDLKMV